MVGRQNFAYFCFDISCRCQTSNKISLVAKRYLFLPLESPRLNSGLDTCKRRTISTCCTSRKSVDPSIIYFSNCFTRCRLWNPRILGRPYFPNVSHRHERPNQSLREIKDKCYHNESLPATLSLPIPRAHRVVCSGSL